MTDRPVIDHEDTDDFDQGCWHIAIVSISDTKCQCMDCMMIWDKEPDFKSDFPEYDRG